MQSLRTFLNCRLDIINFEIQHLMDQTWLSVCYKNVRTLKVSSISWFHSDWKPGKTGEHFPVREKSGNFAKTGKVREFYPKY